MREPNQAVQALRDRKPAEGAASKPLPPPMRVIEKGIFTYRQIKPPTTTKAG